jgi:cell wall-active antibiotic response 4TMS protein YvqF
MSGRDFDPAALASGLVVAALGVVLLLDQVNTIDLSFGYLAPALLAVVGSILLALGLAGRR